MLVLVLTLLIALIFSFMALQNSQPVDVQFAGYALSGIPLYMLIIVSMITGVLVSLVVNLGAAISSSMMLFGKDRKIKTAEAQLDKLQHQLEDVKLENSKLKGGKHEPLLAQSAFAKPNAFQKIRHRLSF